VIGQICRGLVFPYVCIADKVDDVTARRGELDGSQSFQVESDRGAHRHGAKVERVRPGRESGSLLGKELNRDKVEYSVDEARFMSLRTARGQTGFG
jgi:hypothetical protein